MDTREGTANKIAEKSGNFQTFQWKHNDYTSRKTAVSLGFVMCGRRHIMWVTQHIFTPVHFWY